MSLQQTPEMDADEKIARLKEAARERWGERWTVEVRYFADGDFSANAVRSRGQTEEGHLKQDVMFITDDGEIVGERIVLERREVSSEKLDLSDPEKI